MSVLIRVAVQEIEQFVEGLVTRHCQSLGHLVTGDAVDGKYVDIDAGEVVAVGTFDECGAAVDNLAKASGVGGGGLDAQGFEGRRQPLVGMYHKTVVVGTGHTDVHIVIPRDKAFVTYGSQHGASPTVVLDIVLTADTIDRQQDLQDVLM